MEILELRNTIINMRNLLQGFNSRLQQTEECISELKDSSF